MLQSITWQAAPSVVCNVVSCIPGLDLWFRQLLLRSCCSAVVSTQTTWGQCWHPTHPLSTQCSHPAGPEHAPPCCCLTWGQRTLLHLPGPPSAQACAKSPQSTALCMGLSATGAIAEPEGARRCLLHVCRDCGSGTGPHLLRRLHLRMTAPWAHSHACCCCFVA